MNMSKGAAFKLVCCVVKWPTTALLHCFCTDLAWPSLLYLLVLSILNCRRSRFMHIAFYVRMNEVVVSARVCSNCLLTIQYLDIFPFCSLMFLSWMWMWMSIDLLALTLTCQLHIANILSSKLNQHTHIWMHLLIDLVGAGLPNACTMTTSGNQTLAPHKSKKANNNAFMLTCACVCVCLKYIYAFFERSKLVHLTASMPHLLQYLCRDRGLPYKSYWNI